jgi:acetoin utilization deacetylase AcuC-like enzyme
MRIVYSENHRLHATSNRIPGYAPPVHEIPERAEKILAACQAAALGPVEQPADHGLGPILAVHGGPFVEFLRTVYAASRDLFGANPVSADTFPGRGWRHTPAGLVGLIGYHAFDLYAPILEGTWAAAYWSAQCALTAAALVRNGDRVAYALCRPPGHHASASLCGGFCYLNNAAIAARSMQTVTGTRVAILDIDYHHGNGTQEIFYTDPTVMCCSLHADPEVDYPFYWGGAEECGEGQGRGFNRNWPLPHGTGDPTYLAALEQALAVIGDFAPNYLVVSVGFDLMQGDPVPLGGGFRITPTGLRAISERLSALRLPTVIVQEGGYQVDRLGEYAVTFLHELSESGEGAVG